jgi:hypothetical protein
MNKFKKGEVVQLVSNAKFITGKEVPASVIKEKIYIREVKEDGEYTISIVPRGPITGVVAEEMLRMYEEIDPDFTPYLVRVAVEGLSTYSNPGVQNKKVTTLKNGRLYTVVGEKEGFGRLKNGRGWVDLDCVKVIKPQ